MSLTPNVRNHDSIMLWLYTTHHGGMLQQLLLHQDHVRVDVCDVDALCDDLHIRTAECGGRRPVLTPAAFIVENGRNERDRVVYEFCST